MSSFYVLDDSLVIEIELSVVLPSAKSSSHVMCIRYLRAGLTALSWPEDIFLIRVLWDNFIYLEDCSRFNQ